jgi:hypothetical protein
MWVQFGSPAWAVLLYAVSEPGYWTPFSVADDIGEDRDEQMVRAADRLRAKGLLKKGVQKLWPTKKGKQVIQTVQERTKKPIRGVQLELFQNTLS